jgi:hypothetical protein
MQFLDVVTRFWERAAPVLGVVLFLVRVLTFFLRRNPDVSPPRTWRMGRGSSSTTRFYAAPRPHYPKRWSVNDIPRP